MVVKRPKMAKKERKVSEKYQSTTKISEISDRNVSKCHKIGQNKSKTG